MDVKECVVRETPVEQEGKSRQCLAAVQRDPASETQTCSVKNHCTGTHNIPQFFSTIDCSSENIEQICCISC